MVGRHEMSYRNCYQRPARGGAGQKRIYAVAAQEKLGFAAFIGAQSLQKPFEYDDPDATANANLSARLPICSQFVVCHYLKCIVRDKIGSFKERDDMEKWLNKWISNYVESNPATASEEDKARRPLAAAEVVVEEVKGNPGYYTSKFFLRPHYSLKD